MMNAVKVWCPAIGQLFIALSVLGSCGQQPSASVGSNPAQSFKIEDATIQDLSRGPLSSSTPVPRITDFYPMPEYVGETITIEGKHFRDHSKVKFGKVEATPILISADGKTMQVKIPEGAEEGPITLISDEHTIQSPAHFIPLVRDSKTYASHEEEDINRLIDLLRDSSYSVQKK